MVHQHYIWEDNTSFISSVEAKQLLLELNTLILLHFLYKNKLTMVFPPKYDNSSVIMEDMCTKPCFGQIISQGTNLINGFRFYPTIDT